MRTQKIQGSLPRHLPISLAVNGPGVVEERVTGIVVVVFEAPANARAVDRRRQHLHRLLAHRPILLAEMAECRDAEALRVDHDCGMYAVKVHDGGDQRSEE